MGAGKKASRGDGVETVGSGIKHRKKASVDEEEWLLQSCDGKNLVTEKPVMLKEVKGRIVMEKEVMENL